LIVDDEGTPSPGSETTRPYLTARELLSACVREAERQAEALTRLDAAVGLALIGDATQADPRVLQKIDLLRQESQGLARVLGLVDTARSPETVLDAGAVAACLPVADQRRRLMS
jgi:hypothetical protein